MIESKFPLNKFSSISIPILGNISVAMFSYCISGKLTSLIIHNIISEFCKSLYFLYKSNPLKFLYHLI